MGVFVLDWKGPEVRRKVAVAAAVGLDATMEEGVAKARESHEPYPPASPPDTPYANRTGALTGSTTVKVHAVFVSLTKIVGTWGSSSGHALYDEIGTSRRDSGAPRAQVRALAGAAGSMWDISYPSPAEHPLMAPRLYLRPAAQDAYAGLGRRIAEAYNAETLG